MVQNPGSLGTSGEYSAFCCSFIFFFLCIYTSLIARQGTSIENRFDEAYHHFQYKEYEETLEILDEINPELCSHDSYRIHCAHSEIIRANIFRNRTEFDRTDYHLERAQAIFDEQIGYEHPLIFFLWTEKANIYMSRGKFEDALEFAEEAMQTGENLGFSGTDKALVHLTLGTVHDDLGNYETSIQHYLNALLAVMEKEHTIEVINILSRAHNNIGIGYRRVGNVEKAMEHYQLNLNLLRDFLGNNHIELAYVYNSIGSVQYSLGDYATAADHFLRTAEIIRVNYGENTRQHALTLNNAGSTFLMMGDLDRAVDILERAQRIRENVLGLDHVDTAVGYVSIADIHKQNRNHDEALENYKRALAIRKRVYGSDNPLIVTTLNQIGDQFSALTDFDSAREFYHQAKVIVQTRIGENHPDIWHINKSIGLTYFREENYQAAEEYFLLAYRMMVEDSGLSFVGELDLTRLSHPLQFMDVNNHLADLYLKKFDLNGSLVALYDAFRYYRYAAFVVDFLQFQYQSEASKLNLVDRNYSIYTNAVKTSYYLHQETGDERWLHEILYLSELSRARIALELLQDMEARNFAGVPDEIVNEEREINSKITRFYQIIHREQEKGEEADGALISSYRDSLFDEKSKLQQFIEGIEQHYPVYFQLKFERNLADFETIASLLEPDETLVKYIVGERDLFVLSVYSNQLSVKRLDPGENLTIQIQNLRNAITADDASVLADLGYSIYQTLLEPVIDEIQTGSIIIIPDQSLHYLPFEMLLTQSSENHNYYDMPFLIREKKIMYAPSATVLKHMIKSRPVRPRHLLAVAPFSNSQNAVSYSSNYDRYVSEFSSLPLTSFEAGEIEKLFRSRRSITDLFYPHRAEVILDNYATKQVMMNKKLEEYSFIHFATHAFVNESNPELSGIVFWDDDGEDGILYVNDIYNLRMNADLVVLGACETGLGTLVRGEGLIGFTRAFIYAGASNLVVSMWRVNDQPTSRLMIRFYGHIREGYPYNEALHLAKLDFIKHPELASPKNWAAFVLHGR